MSTLTYPALYTAAHGVATITLNRPDKLNAFSAEMFEAIRFGLDQAEKDPDVRVVIFTGQGRAFSSGQDLTEKLPSDPDGRINLGPPLERDYNPLALRLMSYPKITVAAINGPAVGAAANLVLACDLVVAARSAYVQEAFSRIALIPDAGGTWLLPRIVGSKLALALVLTGDKVSAEDGQRMGLIYKVFDDESFAADVAAFVAPLARGPASAYRLIKQAMARSLDHDFATQLKLEADLQNEAGKSEDFQEAIAAFVSKRAPVFRGR
jgi:2-(1,2-epoxy-1,2-dihydrophenyl)acetyl-CoA isomerase